MKRAAFIVLLAGLVLGCHSSSAFFLHGGSKTTPVTPPVATGMLMSSRFQLPIELSTAGSATGQNSRISSINESGATVNSMQVFHTGWYGIAPNESNGANSITISASIEYPTGTFNQVTWGSLTSKTITATGTLQSDTITLATPIPAAARYWVRTYVTVSAGQRWPQGYIINSFASGALGEAVHQSAGEPNLSMGGAISNQGVDAYGPIGAKWITATGTPKTTAIAGLGDSIILGQFGDGNTDLNGNRGWLGRACSGKFPYANFGIGATRISANQPANYAKRIAALQMMGVTHIVTGWGFNDLNGGNTAATILANMQNVWNDLNTLGYKVIQPTVTVVTNSSNGWTTVGGQTVTNPNFQGGTSSQHHVLNASIIAHPVPLFAVLDVNSVVENDATNADGLWKVNSSWGQPNYTADGVHPSNNNQFSTPAQGGVFAMRDYASPIINGW